jgi:uncharacterized protein (TIGR03067 family)
MRLFILAWGLASLAACNLVSAADAPALAPAANEAAERQRLVGTWVGFAVDGKGDHPDRGPVKMELTITEKSMRGVQLKDQERVDHGAGEFVLALADNPRHLDASKTSERGRKEEWVGVYTLEGDTLKWCVGRRDRPKVFETTKGQFLLILKRQPAKK